MAIRTSSWYQYPLNILIVRTIEFTRRQNNKISKVIFVTIVATTITGITLSACMRICKGVA